jgi:hypothetical protein
MPRPRAAALLELSRLYEQSGDLITADARATEGLRASKELVDMYVLPRHIAAAAQIKARLGDCRRILSTRRQPILLRVCS